MDSFELNKILGAVLATCLVLLVSSFTAGAIFAPVKPEKPGYDIAVKEDDHAGRGKEERSPGRRQEAPRPARADRKAATDRLGREGRGGREEMRRLPHVREG